MPKDKDLNFKKKSLYKFRTIFSQIKMVINTKYKLNNNKITKVLLSIKELHLNLKLYLIINMMQYFTLEYQDKYCNQYEKNKFKNQQNLQFYINKQKIRSKNSIKFFKNLVRSSYQVNRFSNNQYKKESEQIPHKNSESLTITNNEISYIKYLEQLSNGISKKYVIEYFKKQKIKSDQFINLIYLLLQIEQELFEFQ